MKKGYGARSRFKNEKRQRGGEQLHKHQQIDLCLQELLKYHCPVKATAGPALFAALEKRDQAPQPAAL